MGKINSIIVSGTSYDIEDSGATKTVELTQAEYDALVTGGTLDANTFYVISDAPQSNMAVVKMTLQEYASISGHADTNTLYVIGDSNGYIMKVGNVPVS